MSVLFAFGTPGVGKSFVGRILHHEYGYFHYEADEDLTVDMIEAIQKEQVFTDLMRQNYFDIIIEKIQFLQHKYDKIVVTQALIKEKNRQQIKNAILDVQFLHVIAAVKNINQRLKIRDNWVSIAYANQIREIFEPPRMPHITIDNNLDKKHVMLQLDAVL